MAQPNDPISLLRASNLFGGLHDEDYELLFSGTRLRRFDAGETLFYEGEEGDSAFLIVEGSISIERTADSSKGDSETIVLAVRGSDEFIGELSLFDKAQRSADARATVPTVALEIRGKHVMRCAEQSPELALSLIRTLGRKLREATERRTHARVANVHDRLLRVLEDEARLNGLKEPGGVRIPIVSETRRLTQTELGVRTGCARAVVNRTLSELEAEGRIRRDRASILVVT